MARSLGQVNLIMQRGGCLGSSFSATFNKLTSSGVKGFGARHPFLQEIPWWQSMTAFDV